MGVTIATYNIHFGIGLDGRYDIGRIADTVADADIILLQEVTRGFPGNGGVDMVADLANLFADRFMAFDMACDSDMGGVVIDGKARENRFQFGNMIVSRWPLTSVRRHLLPRRFRADRLNLQRGAVEALVVTPVGPVRFISTHLDHVDAAERRAQAAVVRDIAISGATTGLAVTGAGEFGFADPPLTGHVVVGGDFNFGPDDEGHRVMTEGDGGLTDISAEGWSFFDPGQDEPHERLDYLFADAHMAARATDKAIDDTADGSDHLPLWVTISV